MPAWCCCLPGAQAHSTGPNVDIKGFKYNRLSLLTQPRHPPNLAIPVLISISPITLSAPEYISLFCKNVWNVRYAQYRTVQQEVDPGAAPSPDSHVEPIQGAQGPLSCLFYFGHFGHQRPIDVMPLPWPPRQISALQFHTAIGGYLYVDGRTDE